MRHHEISPAWRGAPWGRHAVADRDTRSHAEPVAERPRHALALAVLLGLALGATIVQGLAREDRMRFELLMAQVDPTR